MDKPFLLRTGSMPVCSPPEWTQMPENWPLRRDFENQLDVIDAPEHIPAGGVHAKQTNSGGARWQSQMAWRY